MRVACSREFVWSARWLDKPQFHGFGFDRLRYPARMPRRGLGMWAETKPLDQGLAAFIPPAQVESSGLAEAPFKVNQTKSNLLRREG
jgi:hypothetical protein